MFVSHKEIVLLVCTISFVAMVFGCQTAFAAEKPGVPHIDSVVPVASQPHETAEATIWYDDFDGALKKYSEGSKEMNTEEAYGKTGKALECFYAKGSKGKGGVKVFFGDSPTGGGTIVRRGETFNDIYFRVYVKHQAGWEGGAPAKLARVTSMAGADWSQAMIMHVWGGLHLDPATGVEGDKVVTTTYNDFANLKWIQNSPSSQLKISSKEESGYWVLLECRTKLNTPGKRDGMSQIWLDGRLEDERRNMNLRGSYTEHSINAVFLEAYWNNGSPVDQSRYYDNFVISTEPIGPMVCPASPVVILAPYQGPGRRADAEVEIASDMNGYNVVYKSNPLGARGKFKVDRKSGKFTGTLSNNGSNLYADEINGLTSGQKYYIRIRQESSNGEWSDWSRWHQPFVVE